MRFLILCLCTAVLAGCAASTPVAECGVKLRGPLTNAMFVVEEKLTDGCAYSFDGYMDQLVAIAVDDPAPGNKRAFSEFLVRISDQAVISKRQARDLYNRYFNIKFAAFAGDYNTCSQVCPVRSRILSDMKTELSYKELGLMQMTDDADAYYRADHLLKEAELVLEATCRACEAGEG